MDVTDSDHKPVRCKFSVEIAHADRSVRRQEFGKIIRSNEKVRSLFAELRYVPETTVSTNNIVLQNRDTAILRITNKCGKDDAVFEIICEGQSTVKEDGNASDHHPRGSFGFPRWLEVTNIACRCCSALIDCVDPFVSPYLIVLTILGSSSGTIPKVSSYSRPIVFTTTTKHPLRHDDNVMRNPKNRTLRNPKNRT